MIDARNAAKKIRRVATVATGDAWTIAIFAALSFICGLTSGVSGILMGVAMGVVAYVEFTGASRVRRLDASATRTLGYNQLALAGVLIIYALWNLFATSSSGLSAEINSQLGSMGGSGMGVAKEAQDIGQLVNNLVYGSLIAIAIFAQGGTALYYFSREKHITQYVQTTPPWIIEMQRAGGDFI